jgi:FAD:protein FMN transferase
MKTTDTVMGMPITVEIVTDDTLARRGIAAAFDEFNQTDMTFSTYKPGSEISRINRHELATTEASIEVREVLQMCRDLKYKTGGYFDIEHDGEIDPSGLVKGWSIGRAAKRIEELGIFNYYIEAGGDITLRGHTGEGKPWRVGVRNPKNTAEIVKVFEMTQGAICTSGTYARGEHIYNPITGKPAREVQSVTIVGPDVCIADVLATAIFARGSDGITMAKSFGYEAYVILNSNRAVFTDGLSKYFPKA